MKKLLLFFALLCAVAQGALAQNFDVWDGVTMTQPGYVINSRWSITYQINTAAEMAWRYTGSAQSPATKMPGIFVLGVPSIFFR